MEYFHYLDTLPIHPLPQQLESFSSYIMRLAEVNNLNHLRTFSKLLGVHQATISRLTDYPLLSVKELARRTAQKDTTLLATTFFYAGKKFGRSPRANVLARFFAGSLDTHQRYCPYCLSDTGYYPLTWRFTSLVGYSIHACRLLDQCGHCGDRIPLFNPRSRIGECLVCRKSIRACHTQMLSQQEIEDAHRSTTYLEYILSPQEYEEDSNIAKLIGQNLRTLRQQKHLTVHDMAHQLAIPSKCLQSLENGNKERSVVFQTYLKYTSYLNVSLETLFTHASTPSQEPNIPLQKISNETLHQQNRRQQREHDLLKQVQKTIQALRDGKETITLAAISRQVGLSPQALKKYSPIQILWQQISNELRNERVQQRKQYGDDLVEQVQQAITRLATENQPLTEKAISAYVQKSVGQLRRNSQVNALLKQVLGKKSSKQNLSDPKEDLVVKQVNATIASLQAANQPLSHQAICRHVGISLYKLKLYPQVNSILSQVTEEGRLHRRQQAQLHDQEMLEKVKMAIEQLRKSGQPITIKAISTLMGITPRALQNYPSVEPLLNTIVLEYQQTTWQRTQQHEDTLIDLVRQTICQLQENNQPITQRAIGKIINMTYGGLLYYPRFRMLYHQVMEEQRQFREQQAVLREDNLLEQIQDIIEQLKLQGKLVTQRGIAAVIGMKVASLLKYPRIYIIFHQIAEENRRKNKAKK